MAARTDVHAPKNLVTEDYEYLWAFDRQQPGVLVNVDMDWWRSITNWAPETADRGTHQCHHCGAHIRYVAILRHLPTGRSIAVGEQCLDNRFERATAEFHRMRKAAELDRKAQRIVTRRNEWFAEDPTRQVAYDFCAARLEANDLGWENIYHSFLHKVNRYGDTSDKFVAMILRAKARHEEREANPPAPELKAEVPEGRYVITGEVISTKWHDNDFGGSLKMTVKVTTEAGSYRVWGTVPSKMDSPERGDVVSIKATVTRSNDDPSFGFFKRPVVI